MRELGDRPHTQTPPREPQGSRKTARVAVWAGALPGAEIDCFHLAAVETDDGIAVAGLPELDQPRLVALLVEPFTFPVGLFLTSLNEAHERIPLVGGIAAGGRQPGAQALILDDALHTEGAVGAVVSGQPVLTVVSQGCRPIGREAAIRRPRTPARGGGRNPLASVHVPCARMVGRGIASSLVNEVKH